LAHDAAVVVAVEPQQGRCNVRLGLAHAIEERRERAYDRAVLPERCGEAVLETGADQPLMRCVHKSGQLQVEPGSHGYDERHPHS
jgi:hypothetical protein